MGFCRDVCQLQKQGKEIDKTWHPGAGMAQALPAMQSAGATMEQQTGAARLAVRVNSAAREGI